MPTATLTTLTPVHIGNGQKLIRDFDFIVDQGQVGFIDLEKIVGIIGQDKIGQLTASIEKRVPIIKFLQDGRGQAKIKLEDICHKIALPKYKNSSANELKEQYHTSLKGACIPGSSLKGALRSGILKYLTSESRNSENQQRNLFNKINLNARADQVFKELDRLLFGNDANSKTTRFLTVGDVQFDNTKTEIHELSYDNLINTDPIVWNFQQNKAQLVECLPENIKTNFQLKINLDLATKYTNTRNILANGRGTAKMEPLRDLTVFGNGESDFLKNINEATISTMQYDYEKLHSMEFNEEILQKMDELLLIAENCKKGEAVVRVGGHSGWNYITNRWMIYDSEDVLPDIMYDQLRYKVQKTNRYLDINMFPKTRKRTQNMQLLGFVKIAISK